MKRSITTLMIMLVSALSTVSYGQTSVVGSEDFESYELGIWDSLSASNANPEIFNGTTAATIIDDGGTNQQLQVDIDMINQWFSGVRFNLDMSNNVSENISDYTVEVFVRFDPSSDLSNVTFEVLATDPNNALQGTHLWPTLWDPDGYDAAKTNGYTFVMPLDWGETTGDTHLNPALSTWRMEFYCGNSVPPTYNKLITFFIDDVTVKYTVPEFLNPSGSPVGYYPTNTFTLSGTVIDGTLEVDAMVLELDGVVVASNNTYAGGSTTNTITYNVVDLDTGVHSGSVLAMDSTGTNTVFHEWEFYCAGPPAPPTENPIALYNFNHAGVSDPGFSKSAFPVSNGLVAAAPPIEPNNWFNAIDPNPWWTGDSNWEGIEANGSGTWSNITVNTVFASAGGDGAFVYVPWTWGNNVEAFEFAASNTIWGGVMGGLALNTEIEIGNLDSDLTYDLYLYFVSPNATTCTTTYALTTGYAPIIETSLVADQSAMFDGPFFTNHYVLATNYVVLTEILPIDGTIGLGITGDANGGGLSAFQLAVRPPQVVGPTVPPNIQSIALGGGMVSLEWDSESNVVYSVLSKPDLTDTNWTAVTNGIPGAGATTSASVPASSDKEFFTVMGE